MNAVLKILHTADWHLGQTFFDYDRKVEHLAFLNWLKQQLKFLNVDVLLIAGDIFDSPNPSAESQKTLYRFLREITMENTFLQVVIVAGNHDSAARLEAPNPLLKEMNIMVKGVVRRTPDGALDYEHLLVSLMKKGKPAAWCLAVPYLRQGDYPEAENYAQGVRKMYEALYEKVRGSGKPIIAMGHLQATGSEISENDRSERTVIGGLECVSPDAFAKEISYTALGHLHRAQRVSGRENIRYAGAPLPMSFAEKNNHQGVTLVEISDVVKIEHIDFEAPVRLLSIPNEPQSLPEVIHAIEKLPDGEVTPWSPYLEIKVLITEPEPSLRHYIENALQGKSVRLVRISATTPKIANSTKLITYEELQTINPMDMASDIFKQRYGNEEMPESMKALLQKVIREVEA